MKPLNQGTHFLNLKLAWAFVNGLQLPISAAAYSTTGQQMNSNPPSSCASPRHAACLEMDVLRRGAEVIPAGYLKGEVPGDCQITAIKRVLKGFSHQGFWITWYSYHIQHREAEYKTRHFGRKNTAERPRIDISRQLRHNWWAAVHERTTWRWKLFHKMLQQEMRAPS